MKEKFVYAFKEGKGSMVELLGGKGSGLCGMTQAGFPVPQGFVVTTEVCVKYLEKGGVVEDEVKRDIFEHMTALEKETGRTFGDPNNPLLVAVRSGARVSMPGMMDTVLNLGINDKVVVGFAKKTNNERFAYDSYRRFIQMYSDVCKGVPHKEFEAALHNMKEARKVQFDSDLGAEDLKVLCEQFKAIYKKHKNEDFPQDPKVQLLDAVRAVFDSWNSERAFAYRKMASIPHEWGTAVTVQSMVFGNYGPTSGTGVAFTRNPVDGTNEVYGEYLMNAQGEDVVAGIRTPQQIKTLEKQNPAVYKQFCDMCKKLESVYKEMQDLEFTIEDGKLFILQQRKGKRTAHAALKIAVDLVKEKLMTEQEALLSIDANQLNALLHPQFDKAALSNAKKLATGLPASPGAACGVVVFSAEEAVKIKASGKKVILVRQETSPEDIEGMIVAEGILTARGGMTSHAAVVARGMGKCCVAGCSDITFFGDAGHEEFSSCKIAGVTFKSGSEMSIDGGLGNVYAGIIPTVPASVGGDFETVMNWADKYKAISVRANAETPKDVKQAVAFGAVGVGLARTEHMFFEADRIPVVRQMILSKTLADRQKALDKLEPMQKKDFVGIFEALNGFPATIRLLDPPLHEFLPQKEADIIALAKEMKVSAAELKAVVDGLHELNPMLGHRGCRLSITYPELTVMQTKAIIGAAIDVAKKGIKVSPEIMIPLIVDVKEYTYLRDIVKATADKMIAEAKINLPYMIGTMIETPRGAIMAESIAKEAEFFSFGTNDLTQMTYGFSRDDIGKFIQDYYDKKLFLNDPFAKLDQQGVGTLVKMAVDGGKRARANIKLGICGEHGGEPTSVMFCHDAGLNYVSCSPFRVPIARLAAAQANIKNPRK